MDKSVKLKVKEPFETIEKLILFTKESIKEQGFDDFKDCIFDEKDNDMATFIHYYTTDKKLSKKLLSLEAILHENKFSAKEGKKNPKRSGYKGSICTKWWA